jgi:hypothetical protein
LWTRLLRARLLWAWLLRPWASPRIAWKAVLRLRDVWLWLLRLRLCRSRLRLYRAAKSPLPRIIPSLHFLRHRVLVIPRAIVIKARIRRTIADMVRKYAKLLLYVIVGS